MAPVQPISSPFALAAHYGLSSHVALTFLFLAVVVLWALYSLVALYHWVRYSHAALIAIPAILVHLFVSGVLILFSWQALAAL